MEKNLGLKDLVDATYLALVALQAGIGALTLPDAWAVVAPLAAAVALAFFARLAGRKAASEEMAAEVVHLHDEIGRLIIENGRLRSERALPAGTDNLPDPEATAPI